MVVRELDGTVTTYDEVDVDGDRVERLLTELFSEHWAAITVGPLVEGAAYEIRFAAAPKVSMLDGYMTIDTGAWHFHLCVGDHRASWSVATADEGPGLIETDRPDLTNGVKTVPPGAAQIETGVAYARRSIAASEAERRLAIEATLRVGLTDRLEVRLDGEPLVRLR